MAKAEKETMTAYKLWLIMQAIGTLYDFSINGKKEQIRTFRISDIDEDGGYFITKKTIYLRSQYCINNLETISIFDNNVCIDSLDRF